MKKNNAVQTASTHSMLANQAPVPQKSKVSSQMTLSDSILSGAVVEFRKAGYRFMRHLHVVHHFIVPFFRSHKTTSFLDIFYFPTVACSIIKHLF